MENKITEILTVDYVFIPYQSEKDINIREDGIVYKLLDVFQIAAFDPRLL